MNVTRPLKSTWPTPTCDRIFRYGVLCLVALVLLVGCSGHTQPTDTPLPTDTPRPAATPTPPPKSTIRLGRTHTPSETYTPLPEPNLKTSHKLLPMPTPASALTLSSEPTAAPTRNVETPIDPLSWMHNGSVGIFEPEAVSLLEEMKSSSPVIFEELSRVERRWLPPRSGADLSVIRSMASISEADEMAALRLIEMPFLESVEWVDLEAVRYLDKLARSDPGYLWEVLSHPDFGDGITDEQAITVPLLYLRGVDPDAADRLEAMPWVQDGIAYFGRNDAPRAYRNPTVLERFTALDLVDAALEVRDTFWALTGKSWLRGRWTDTVEIDVMQSIIELAYIDEATSLRVLAMPFLDTYQNPDAFAVGFLTALIKADPAKLDAFLPTPALAGGITDANKGSLRDILLQEVGEPQAWKATPPPPQQADGAQPPAWVVDPPDRWHADASETIGALWLLSPELGRTVAQQPWVADGMTVGESYELAKVAVTATGNPELVEDLLAHWNAHGFSRKLFWHVHAIALVDADAARRVLDLSWVKDDITQPESNVLSRLTGRKPVDTDILLGVLDLPWVADGITETEAQGAKSIIDAWRSDKNLGKHIISFPWVADGITENESISLRGLSIIAYADPSLAWQVVTNIEELMSLPGDLAVYALAAMGQLGEFPENLRPLTKQPWFADGLSPEEAAFISALGYVNYHHPTLYADLLQSRFTLAQTIFLPLAGEVNIWAFQNVPFPEDEDLFGVAAEAARITERLIGAPFPTTDAVILFVVPGGDVPGIAPEGYWYDHLRFNRGANIRFDEGKYAYSIRYGIVDYYFNFAFAPAWLSGGGRDFAVAYINDQTGVQSFEDRAEMVSRWNQPCTAAYGKISVINKLYDFPSPPPECAYTMGNNFLHRMSQTIGLKAVSAALREVHELDLNNGRLVPPSEEEIYRSFLKNTPPGLEGKFQQLYEELHGEEYDNQIR